MIDGGPDAPEHVSRRGCDQPISDYAYDHLQLSAIKVAAERVAEAMGAVKEKDKMIVARAVFDIAADTMTFDANKLVVMARERLTPRLGWRFA